MVPDRLAKRAGSTVGAASAKAAGMAARTSAGATGACDTCPPRVPQHSRPIALQAARSAPLIGQAEEKHTGAPRKGIRRAVTVSAAEARRRLFTGCILHGMIDGLTLFGLFAVTAMLVCYALEDRSPWFVLAFAGACGLGSAYGFLQGAWPFGLVEAVWSVVAVWRWWRVARRLKP